MNIAELTHNREDQAAQTVVSNHPSISDAMHVQVLIHTNGALDESAVQNVADALGQMKGFSRIRFDPNKAHLLMLSYDPHTVKSTQLLEKVVQVLNNEAQLVGL